MPVQDVQRVERAAAVDAECRSRTPVRTSICAIARPRSPTVIAGRAVVGHAGVEHDRRVGAALVGADPLRDALEPASSSPSTTTRTLTGSSPRSPSAQAACSSGQKLPLSSPAPRAYRRPSRTSGSNGGDVHALRSPTLWTS
jgi:hypothetical protein